VWSRKVGALILAAWFLLILFHFEYSTDRNRSALNVYLSLHNLNFFIGMLAFLIFKKYDSHICRRVLVGGLFVFVGLVIAESVFDYKYQTSLIYALSFGCLLTGAVSIESQNKRQKLRVASIIGDSSYSIYLLHLAFQSFLLKIGLGLHWDQLIGRAGIYFFALIGSIIGGCFIYIYLERPILRVLRAQFAD
jgi:peptidoglycan/LPS O-acetylase OafA/YrhL